MRRMAFIMAEGADAVGDEVGRVVRVDDGLAEALVAEVRDGGDVGGIGVGRWG